MLKAFVIVIALAVCGPALAQDNPTPLPAATTSNTTAVFVKAPAPKSEQAQSGGGVIEIGQILGPFLQPYVDEIVNALILGAVGWVVSMIHKKTGIQIDESHRDALVRALQNQAGSLIADGFVKVSGAKITVDNKALAESANEVLAVVPDAVEHFGLKPDYIAKRIVDIIPQTHGGAALVAMAAQNPPGKA